MQAAGVKFEAPFFYRCRGSSRYVIDDELSERILFCWPNSSLPIYLFSRVNETVKQGNVESPQKQFLFVEFLEFTP